MEPFVHEQLQGRVVFGAGRLDALPDEIDRMSAGRVALVASRSNREDASRARELLGRRFSAWVAEAHPHVPAGEVAAARGAVRQLGSNCLVAVGGGSAIGLAKAVTAELGVPLLVVPTTYSGSEMTPYFGITEDGRKKVGRAEKVRPRVVIYDPELTMSLPGRVTSGTGMNAVAHCIEALYAPDRDPVSSMFAANGFEMLVKSLPACVADPKDIDARSEALYGSYLAGSSLATTTMGLHHRICHVLGGSFDIGHGDANAIMLPHVLAYNAEASQEARRALVDGTRRDDPVAAVKALADSLEAPKRLAEVGFDPEDIDKATFLILESEPANPAPVTKDIVRALLTAAS